jgi:NodT family efflux transporter outer membrane factor (OMF) lipoprotein
MNCRALGRLLLGCLFVHLAACSVGPAYKRPDIPAPGQWQENPVQDNSAPAAPVWPAADWWHEFGSTRLDELIAEAQRSNDDLAAAIARVQEADAQVRIAGAPLLPTVDLGATATRQRAPVTGVGPEVYNVFSPQISASYELDFWGKNRAARAAALATASASRFDQQTVALTVISSVAGTYFQALELRDRIEVARHNLENGQSVLHGLKAEQAAGTATGLDVAQQDTTVALLNAAIPPLLEQFRQTVYALAVLLGRTPESLQIDAGTLTELAPPAVVEGLPSQLLSRRPDIAEAEQQLIAANADITVARAAFFPSIDLTASGGYESTALATLVNPYSRIYSIGAGLTQPIFHGGAIRGQYQYSQARYTELVSTYHKTVITAFSNVESALVAARQTSDQQLRQAEAVSKAQRAFEFAKAQMRAGIVNVLTVLNTENALFTAQDTLVQVQYAHLQALVDLFTALGGGWHQG